MSMTPHLKTDKADLPENLESELPRFVSDSGDITI
jgi:hypothetical protein